MDVMAYLPDKSLLDQFGISVCGSVVADEKHLPLFKAVDQLPKTNRVPGGCGLNTIRIAAIDLKNRKPGARLAFSGAAGDDESMKTIERTLKKDGIDSLIQKVEGEMTGTCLCLILNKERSFCYTSGASGMVTSSHFNSNIEILRESKLVYSSLYFVPDNQKIFDKVLDFCA